MPEFSYIARELSGTQTKGILSAASEQDALGILSAKSLFPLSVTPVEDTSKNRLGRQRKVRQRDLAVFYTQMADLLRSGVPLLRSLELLERKSAQPALAPVIQDVREQVADGMRLAAAMKRHPKVFGDLAVSMVRAGEEGSFLEDVLTRIAIFTEHQENLKSRIVGAMVYPAFLVGIGTIILTVILVVFVPKFATIFARMQERGQLPWATTALLGMSEVVKSYWWIVLAVVVVFLMWFRSYVATDAGRLRFDRLRMGMLKIGPVSIGVGNLVRSVSIARFCRILGTLLNNGVPILQSLQIAKDAAGNLVLSHAIAAAADSVSTGESLAGPFSQSGEFPDEVVEMISVGEEANNLEQVLVNVADTMERNTNRQLELFVRMLEPVMLSVIAGVVLFVVVALLLPILQSSGLV